MEENMQKDGVVLAPVTPVNLGCRGLDNAGAVVQESSYSADNKNIKLDSTNSDGNLFRYEEFCGGVRRKTGFAVGESEKSPRIDGSRGKVSESGKVSCMQILFSQIARAQDEVIRPVQLETSANLSAEETGPSVHKRAGFTETEPGNDFGTEELDSAPDLSQSEKNHSKKRKKTGIDLNKKPRKRMKVKKHRPKIFDASKPKKVPKAKKERKNVRKSRKIETPESDSPLAPKVKKERKNVPKTRKIGTPESDSPAPNPRTPHTPEESDSPAPNPHTPEPLPPKLVMCKAVNLCEAGKLDDNNGQTANQSSEQATRTRRVLNYGKEDQMTEGSHGNGMLNVGSAGRIITYQRRCRKSGDKSIFWLLLLSLKLEPEDFDSSTGMEKIIEEYQRRTVPLQQWNIKALEFLNFPKSFKQRRTRRRKRTIFSMLRLREGDKLYNGHKATTKERLNRLGATSNNKKNLASSVEIPLAFPPVPKRKRSKMHRRHNLGSQRNQSLSNSFPESLKSGDYTSAGPCANVLCAETCPSMGTDSLQGGFRVENLSHTEIFPVAVVPSFPANNSLTCDDALLDLKLGLPQYDDIQVTSEQKNFLLNIEKDDIPDIEDFGSNAPYTEDLLDVIQKLEFMHIKDESRQLVVRDQNATGTLVPHKGRIGARKKQPPPKVDLDQETLRCWNMLMENDGSEEKAQNNEEQEKWWEAQRGVFHKRVESFIARMHLFQGDRRFSQWKGSVVDSVVGVYLTQNVSDHLSSSAYMSLASSFPLKSESDNLLNEDKDNPISQALIGINIGDEELKNDKDCMQSYASQIKLHKNQEWAGNREETIAYITEEVALGLAGGERPNTSGVQEFLGIERESTKATSPRQVSGGKKAVSKVERIIYDCSTNCQGSHGCNLKENIVKEDKISSVEKHKGDRKGNKTKKNDNDSIKRKGKVEEKKKQNPIDWDQLRKTYSTGRNNPEETMDSVDWEKVRRATTRVVSSIIARRGMHNVIGERIKNFLDRMVKDHGSIDLEWLRDVPPYKAKEYLLSIDGLGLKSVECVRLLTLHHHAFPVDTNVGRLAVRLGWVPLEPLPGNLEIDLLNNYPPVDSIQKYLWPRLCKLPQKILYELHYQMITFGKVFCTKKNPKCNECPLRGECVHFASAFARAKLRLPGPQEQNTARTSADDDSRHENKSTMLLLECSLSESIYGTQSCDPIIEIPASPELQHMETLERDIEDLWDDDYDDEIPTISLSTEEFRKSYEKLRKSFSNSVEAANLLLHEGDMSKALVAVTPEAASIPAPKLRTRKRLRTEHHVYELPDWHPLLAEYEKREHDDPCPYLFAVWLSGDAVKEQNNETVSGTILIPCRTANRGSFPLNGTYFQVNEVFADDESSRSPISVPRKWLWNLPRRTLYCGTSATSIFRELTIQEIQRCFWQGFICVRGFDAKTRAPRPLPKRFHPPSDKEEEENE